MCETKIGIARAERDGTRTETRFRLSPKRTTPIKSVGASVQSTAGSRGVRNSLNNAGYTTLGGGVRVLATHSIRQFPLHLPFRASPCATRFRTSSTVSFYNRCPSHRSQRLKVLIVRVWIHVLCFVDISVSDTALSPFSA